MANPIALLNVYVVTTSLYAPSELARFDRWQRGRQPP
jgi:hypothetical protein